MTGETELKTLLRTMEPNLDAVPYGYASVKDASAIKGVFATVRETEGLTVIAPVDSLERIEHQGPFAKISLTVHSSLTAVGLTAALATALAKQGISANVIAGYYHDHVFVDWDKRESALKAIKELSKEPHV